MRVVDGLSVYDMAKKKPKSRQAAKDTASDDIDTSCRCTHITKAISLAGVQKALKQRPFVDHCLDCFKDGLKPDGDDDTGIDTSAWLCLQCAYQGCGRSSPHQHAMKHHQTPRSTSHCLVVNMQNWSCWCYDCDSEVLAEKYPPLLRAVECVQKTNSAALTGRKDQSVVDMKETSSMSTRKASDGHLVDSPASGGARINGSAPAAGLMLPKLKGLNNLGNTCFMNAILQNLCQTHLLEHVLQDMAKKDATFALPGFKYDQTELHQMDPDPESDDSPCSSREQTPSLLCLEPLTVPVLGFGDLTSALRGFITDMNATAKGNIISPANLFNQVCKKAPRFKGLQQQDSHELLRYLLDGMRNEEIFNRKRGILKIFNIRDSTGKDIDDEKKIRLKAYGVQLKHTFVDSIFGGHLLSSVVCLECGHASQVFESFLDLSLPIAENKGADVGTRYNYGELAVRTKRVTRSSKDEDVDSGAAAPAQLSKHQRKVLKQLLKKERKGKGGKCPATAVGQLRPSGAGDPAGQATATAVERRDGDDDDRTNVSLMDANDDADVHAAMPILPCAPDATNCVVLLRGGSCPKSDDEPDFSAHTASLAAAVQYSPVHCAAAGRGGEGNPAAELAACSATEPRSITEGAEDSEQVCDVACLLLNEATATIGQPAYDVSLPASGSTDPADQHQSSAGLLPSSIDTLPSEADRTLAASMGSLHIENGSQHQAGSIILATSAADIAAAALSPPLSPESCAEAAPGHVVTGVDDHTVSNGQATRTVDILTTDVPAAASCCHETTAPEAAAAVAVKQSLVALAPMCKQVQTARTLLAYLERFTADEYLTGSNKFQCTSCSKRKHSEAEREEADCGASGGKKEMVYTDAVKKLLVFSPPAVLTLHLKRFEQVGYSTRKVDSHIEFPLVLDLAPFCSALCTGVEAGQRHVLYSLYGVVEHVGQLNHGHYTAYVRARCAPGSAGAYAAAQRKFMQTELMNYEQPVRTLVGRLTAIRDDGAVSSNPSDPAAAADYCPGSGSCSAESHGHKLGAHSNGSSSHSGKWFHVSDNHVKEASETAVLACQAYILFYERVG